MVCVVPKAPPAPTSFAASFAATANPIDPATWDSGLAVGLDWNDPQSAGGKAFASAIDTAPGGDSDNICCLRTSILTCAPAQWARARVYINAGYSPAGTHELSLLLRFKITAHSARGLECYFNMGGGSSIVEWNGAHSSFNVIGSANPNPPADGDEMYMQIDASGRIKIFQNGVDVTTGIVTSTTFSDGNPGLGNNPCNNAGGTLVNGAGFTSYSCGSL